MLLILDGASEPVDGVRPTSLERARTPALDALVAQGRLGRLRTVPGGLPAGSEAAIPTLLGWTPPAPADRGAIEASAHGIAVSDGGRAWRVDVLAPDGTRAATAEVAQAYARLAAAAPRHDVHRLAGHRLLLVGPAPFPAAAQSPGLRVWPEGVAIPRILDEDDGVVVVCAAGAAAGIARLLGAAVVVPPGATGGPDSDLRAKRVAALAALDAGARRLVVHVGGADEAAHLRDAAAKVAVLERADRELVAPLWDAVRAAGGTLGVCPDHGCDPRTGAHDALPVPAVTWPASAVGAGSGIAARLTERSVAELPVTDAGAAAPAGPRERVPA